MLLNSLQGMVQRPKRRIIQPTKSAVPQWREMLVWGTEAVWTPSIPTNTSSLLPPRSLLQSPNLAASAQDKPLPHTATVLLAENVLPTDILRDIFCSFFCCLQVSTSHLALRGGSPPSCSAPSSPSSPEHGPSSMPVPGLCHLLPPGMQAS